MPDAGKRLIAVGVEESKAEGSSGFCSKKDAVAAMHGGNKHKQARRPRYRPLAGFYPPVLTHDLVVQVLRMIGLREEEPALEQQADVLHAEGQHQQTGVVLRQAGPEQQ